MGSKTEQVRAWLNGSSLHSFEIAAAVGCHPGFVRAIKVRMLNPDRERKRRNEWHGRKYQTDAKYRERRRQSALDGYHRRKAEARAG
jgi:hypothetical protein